MSVTAPNCFSMPDFVENFDLLEGLSVDEWWKEMDSFQSWCAETIRITLALGQIHAPVRNREGEPYCLLLGPQTPTR